MDGRTWRERGDPSQRENVRRSIDYPSGITVARRGRGRGWWWTWMRLHPVTPWIEECILCLGINYTPASPSARNVIKINKNPSSRRLGGIMYLRESVCHCVTRGWFIVLGEWENTSSVDDAVPADRCLPAGENAPGFLLYGENNTTLGGWAVKAEICCRLIFKSWSAPSRDWLAPFPSSRDPGVEKIRWNEKIIRIRL